MDNSEILQLIAPYDHLPLECDGMTRVLFRVFHDNKVPCQVHTGGLVWRDRQVVPHYWIVLEDGSHVDLRARMWLGEDESVPHGVFDLQDYPETEYLGHPDNMRLISDVLFEILTVSIPPLSPQQQEKLIAMKKGI